MEERKSYFAFYLSGGIFAVAEDRVESILYLRPSQKLKQGPALLKGAMDFEGRKLPLIDLKIKVGLPSRKGVEKPSVIVTRVVPDGTSFTIGLIVDRVHETIRLGNAQIHPDTVESRGIRVPFIRGTTEQKGAFIIILDLDHAFTADELASLRGPAVP